MKFINLTPHDVVVILPDTDTETNRRRTFHRERYGQECCWRSN